MMRPYEISVGLVRLEREISRRLNKE